MRLPVPRITRVFSLGKWPSLDSACASLSKIATDCEPFGLNDCVGGCEPSGLGDPGPVSSLAKKIGRSIPTPRPARNAEHQRLNAGVVLLASAAGPTRVLSW